MKLTEDSPSPSLNRSGSVFSSQKQAAQVHSGHLRVNSSYFSPSVLGSEPVLQAPEECQTATENYDVSDITDPITTLSDRSNFMRGEERIVFENAANMIRYHTWFINPFVKPSENDSLLESY